MQSTKMGFVPRSLYACWAQIGLAIELSLLQEHKEEVCSLVMDVLKATSNACAESSGQDQPQREGCPMTLLAKEAAYNAVALGVWSLTDFLDFSSWLRTSLIQVTLLAQQQVFYIRSH